MQFIFLVSQKWVSTKELEKQLGETYKTPWRIANKIRSLMSNETKILKGTVEMDETYMGGKRFGKHNSKKQ